MKRDWFAACFARENQIVPRLTLPKGNESQLEFVYHFIRNPRKRWCFQRFRNLGVGLFPCFFPYGEK